ncbi:hypothetical protein DOQ08_01547 [Marinobacter litoralis]|uniref:Membrane-fusion protein n=1 Tax=Marinobacter litoralis TaxID=187981 RepID=A0A3M2RG01_9GAMM|nr:DUF2806 domain-containing protein [Marinobacter litoralis]RMJ04227.1 hypothetical protein DOQ08_01547 [Marinobacter litoralis]
MDYPGEKLLIKLWETLAEKGVGSLLIPWQEKRVAKARIEIRKSEMLQIAQVEKEVEAIKAGKYSLKGSDSNKLLNAPPERVDELGRVEPTLNLDDLATSVMNNDLSEGIRRETNIAKAILNAEDVLQNDAQEPSEDPVEDDWLFAWRDYAGRVSSSELQDLWGRILAGEVKQPGSYSMRTLEFLKGLSRSEALLISKLARFVIASRIFREKDKFLESEGINFSKLMFLQDIGVLSGVEATGLTSSIGSLSEDMFFQAITANNKVMLLENDDPKKQVKMPVYLLTQIGTEVLKLASFDIHPEYLESVAKDFVRQGFTVKLADWVQQTANSGQFFNAVEITLEQNS